MSFLRPEASAELWRWREVGVGVALAVLGAYLVAAPGWLLAYPGYALIAGGGILTWLGVQRARFRKDGQGPGAVQVDEGRVSYFGPLTGGTVALAELDRLSLDGTLFPAHWKLEQYGETALLIPVNAAGSEALFDAFAVLPGLRISRMLAELRSDRHQTVVIWQRVTEPTKPALLH